ncbi:hypothetical protein AURDEDRAFT_128811 [Auricularia subglabra TFB-10046 SS5]|nr:hypothetical protein AURDEDRAFT_128811 [Auricularia subglabra TFB-10046 SS5]
MSVPIASAAPRINLHALSAGARRPAPVVYFTPPETHVDITIVVVHTLTLPARAVRGDGNAAREPVQAAAPSEDVEMTDDFTQPAMGGPLRGLNGQRPARDDTQPMDVEMTDESSLPEISAPRAAQERSLHFSIL